VRARRRDAGREAAAKAVAAYLADDDAEIYNATEVAVRQDALGAALNLTVLAAEAVIGLAASQGIQPEQALRALTADRLYTAAREPRAQPAAQIVFPASMDDYAWEMTKAKGWIEITVRWAEGEKAVTIYDPVRLAQEVEDAVARQGYFAEPAVVVVPVVTEEAVEAAVAQLAQRRFADIV
jgi:hypothetical protein